MAIEEFASPGKVLTCFDGKPYDRLEHGINYLVTYVDDEPFGNELPKWDAWYGKHFVITKRIRRDGKPGKREQTFVVSPDGSVMPAR